jgi:hypothetical protein
MFETCIKILVLQKFGSHLLSVHEGAIRRNRALDDTAEPGLPIERSDRCLRNATGYRTCHKGPEAWERNLFSVMAFRSGHTPDDPAMKPTILNSSQ